MWLIQNNEIVAGYKYCCPKCEWATLNDQQYYCPKCNVQLDEVRIGD
jgi:uncharacterized paraquat-inducible protein A